MAQVAGAALRVFYVRPGYDRARPLYSLVGVTSSNDVADPYRDPCLVPYADLPESEKEYDRNTAMQTLKAIIALGYGITPRAAGQPVSDLPGTTQDNGPADVLPSWEIASLDLQRRPLANAP